MDEQATYLKSRVQTLERARLPNSERCSSCVLSFSPLERLLHSFSGIEYTTTRIIMRSLARVALRSHRSAPLVTATPCVKRAHTTTVPSLLRPSTTSKAFDRMFCNAVVNHQYRRDVSTTSNSSGPKEPKKLTCAISRGFHDNINQVLPDIVDWDNEESVRAAINFSAKQKLFGVTLRDLFEFGVAAQDNMDEDLVKSARFIHHSLPMRLARCVVMIDDLPYGLPSNQCVQQVRRWYVDSFKQLTQFPEITTPDMELEFCETLQKVLDRHSDVLQLMAMGINQTKQDHSLGSELHKFLDRFYTARIGLRTLIGQQIALHNNQPGMIGLISTDCSPAKVAQAAIEEARYMVDRTYGNAPEVEILGQTNLTFPYIADHLYYMLFELLKNSLRATVEAHGSSDEDLPPVRIVISCGSEDVVIKVSDEGGGIPRRQLPHIWSYLYTTAPPRVEEGNVDANSPVLAGYGFGLPICRLYSRFWGGDTQVIPMEGFGMDAYLYLCRLGDSTEPLP